MWRQRRIATWILPLVLVVYLTRDSSVALTTFGKAPTQILLPPRLARECTQQSDCAGIEGTSCVRTAYDPRTRCLCGDNRSPINGQCNDTIKGLRHVCTDSVECGEGMKCVVSNVTATTRAPTGPQRDWSPSSSYKLCLCADGYIEKDFHCKESAALK